MAGEDVPEKRNDQDRQLVGPKALMKKLRNGEYSDFTLKCDGIIYPVHKGILCAQSGFFAAACDGPFKEAKELFVELKEDDSASVNIMLDYLYLGSYAGRWEQFSDLSLHVQAYIIGDRYDIPRLRTISEVAFIASSQFMDCLDEEMNFIKAVEMVYNNKTIVAKSFRSAIVYLLKDHSYLLGTDEIQELLGLFTSFTYDLAMSIAGVNPVPRELFHHWRVTCDHCRKDLGTCNASVVEENPFERLCGRSKFLKDHNEYCQWVILATDENNQ